MPYNRRMETNSEQHGADGQPGKALPGRERTSQPVGTVDPAANYRRLGQPADTVSGVTSELFEPRGPDSPAATLAFKVIAVVAIVALVAGIVATQLGLVP